MEGVSTSKFVLFHQGSTELQRCENCIFFLPVNTLTGVMRRLLGPHDTLPCVLIYGISDIYHLGLTHLIGERTNENSSRLFYTVESEDQSWF